MGGHFWLHRSHSWPEDPQLSVENAMKSCCHRDSEHSSPVLVLFAALNDLQLVAAAACVAAAVVVFAA